MSGASSLLLLLLLAAPTFSSAAGFRPPPRSGKYSAKAVRSIIKKNAKDYIKDKGEEGVQDFATSKDSHQLGNSAAASYGALTFDLSVGSGSSPQTLSVVMDITSDVVWAQCDDPCASCVRQTPPDTPTFRSNLSDSFVQILCQEQSCQRFLPGDCGSAGDLCWYTDTFFNSGKTLGYLANETFSFGTTAFPGMAFGCVSEILLPGLDGASGFAGFSRGSLSLVSQLQISQFSYLISLPDNSGNSESFLRWTWVNDTTAAPAKGSRSTPLLVPTSNQDPSWYYVKLTGLQVDGQLLTAIPPGTFDAGADGSGGVSLSTTLPVTYLEEAAYNVLREKLLSLISAQGVALAQTAADLNHLCFVTEDFENATVPKLALVFDGSDAAMDLAVENYFFKYDDGQTCLTIIPSTGGSILGSLLQVDTTMTYDLYANGGGLLTFETAAAAVAPTAAGAHPTAQALLPLVTIVVALLAAWGLSLQSLL